MFISIGCCQKEKYDYNKVENEYKQKKVLKELPLNFIGYSYDEISEINAEIKGTQHKKFNFIVSEKILDSIRNNESRIFLIPNGSK